MDNLNDIISGLKWGELDPIQAHDRITLLFSPISEDSERIICAAVWYKEIPIKKEIPFESTNPKNCPTGLVFSGHRHGQCIYTKCAVTGLRDAESGENEQGFLTSKNRFVSREEGLIIALREGQVIDIKEIRGNRLFSEDLY